MRDRDRERKRERETEQNELRPVEIRNNPVRVSIYPLALP